MPFLGVNTYRISREPINHRGRTVILVIQQTHHTLEVPLQDAYEVGPGTRYYHERALIIFELLVLHDQRQAVLNLERMNQRGQAVHYGQHQLRSATDNNHL